MICTILQQLFYYQYLKNNGGSYDIFQQMNVDLDEEITNSRSLEELQSTIQSFFSSSLWILLKQVVKITTAGRLKNIFWKTSETVSPPLTSPENLGLMPPT